jgi:hypothetical protein
MLSVDAVQLRFNCVPEAAVAVRAPGAVGAVVSPPGGSFGVELFVEAVHPCIINIAMTIRKETTATHNLGRGRMIRTELLSERLFC